MTFDTLPKYLFRLNRRRGRVIRLQPKEHIHLHYTAAIRMDSDPSRSESYRPKLRAHRTSRTIFPGGAEALDWANGRLSKTSVDNIRNLVTGLEAGFVYVPDLPERPLREREK